MYERMLVKQITPTMEDMSAYCENCADLFINLNAWLSQMYTTSEAIVFPYGNHYGWCVAHKIKKQLICNIFPEKQAFTVMIRLSNEQFASIYDELQPYAQAYIDHKYSCGNGGWIHYRITCDEHVEDIKKLLTSKCTCIRKTNKAGG